MKSSALLPRAAFIFCIFVLSLLSGVPGQAQAAPGAMPQAARDNGQISVHIQDITPSGPNDLLIYMSVSNSDGTPVIGLEQLKPNPVTVLVDGQQAPLKGLTPVTDASQHIAAAILLDTSYTMGLDDKLPAAKAAIKAFGQSLNLQDQVAFYQLAGHGSAGVKQLLNFTTDHAQLDAVVDPLQAGALGVQAPIYDGLYQAAKDLAALPGDYRKIIVLQTDQHDDGSVHTLAEALDLVKQVHLPIYTIGLGTDADVDTLQTMARDTGGTSFANPDPAGLADSYQTILSQLRHSYQLMIESPTPFQVGSHHVQVEVNYQDMTYKDPPDPVNLSDPSGPGVFVIPATNFTLNFSLHKGDHVAGTTNMTLDVVGDTLPIASVNVQVDGKTIFGCSGTANCGGTHYQFSWSASYVLPGTHTIHIVVTDIEGNGKNKPLDIQVQVGVEWGYWIGVLIQLLLLILAIIVLRYAYYRFLGGKLEGILTVYNAADQKADIELGHDVKGSRMRLKITPDGVLIGAHPPWKKFPFKGPAKPVSEETKDKGASREKRKKKIRALLYVARIRPQPGTKRISVPYYQSKGKKKRRVELKDGMNRRAGDYRIDFSE